MGHTSSVGDGARKRGSTGRALQKPVPSYGFSRILRCKYGASCAHVAHVLKGKCAAGDLNHLIEHSHPRKECPEQAKGKVCVCESRLMSGCLDLNALGHWALHFHTKSRFVTSKQKVAALKSELADPTSASPRSAEDSVTATTTTRTGASAAAVEQGPPGYSELGVMACDGVKCQSVLSRGLWKCWLYRDIVWRYRYPRYLRTKDPAFMRDEDGMIDGARIGDTRATIDEELYSVKTAFSMMYQKVVATAGESFIQRLDQLMLRFYDETKSSKPKKLGAATDSLSVDLEEDSKKQEIESNLLEDMLTPSGVDSGAMEDVKVEDADEYELRLGRLLLDISTVARHEFGLPDDYYPLGSVKTKPWKNKFTFGVLLAIVHSTLPLSVAAYETNRRKTAIAKGVALHQVDTSGIEDLDLEVDIETAAVEMEDVKVAEDGSSSKKKAAAAKSRKESVDYLMHARQMKGRGLLKTPTRNLRRELFELTCVNSKRTLFEELHANGMEHTLKIPRAKMTMHGDGTFGVAASALVHHGSATDSLSLSLSAARDSVHSTTLSPEGGAKLLSKTAAAGGSGGGGIESIGGGYAHHIDHSWTSLQQFATFKLNHPRHVEMGAPLDENEVLAVLLVTSTVVGRDMIRAHRRRRKRDYCKWRVLQNTLTSALRKMWQYNRERQRKRPSKRVPTFYHGWELDSAAAASGKRPPVTPPPKAPKKKSKMKASKKAVESSTTAISSSSSKAKAHSSHRDRVKEAERRRVYFDTFVSTTRDHRVIDPRHTLCVIRPNIKEDNVIWADVSWISKFDFDYEVMFAPSALSYIEKPHSAVEIEKSRREREIRGKKRHKKSPATAMRSTAKRKKGKPIASAKKGKSSKSSSRGKGSKKATAAVKVKGKGKMRGGKGARARGCSLAKMAATKGAETSRTRKISSMMSYALIDDKFQPSSLDGSGSLKLANTLLAKGRRGVVLVSSTPMTIGSPPQKSSALSTAMVSTTVVSVTEAETAPLRLESADLAEAELRKELEQMAFRDLVSKFLFERITDAELWAQLDADSNGYITIDKLETLLFALFAFAIEMQAAHATIEPFVPQIRELAAKYAKKFAADVNSQVIGGVESVKRGDFLKDCMDLHILYDECYDRIIEDLGMSDYFRAAAATTTTTAGRRGADTMASVFSDMGSMESKTSADPIESIETVEAYCAGECDLKQLWEKFAHCVLAIGGGTEIVMSFDEFEYLLWAALAFFIGKRNPGYPYSSRDSLSMLTSELRSSLLDMYDSGSKGYLVFADFGAFGEYLENEYKELRSSISEAQPSLDKQIADATEASEESYGGADELPLESSSEDSESDYDEVWSEDEADDGTVVKTLQKMHTAIRQVVDEALDGVTVAEEDPEAVAVGSLYAILIRASELCAQMEEQCKMLSNPQQRYEFAGTIQSFEMQVGDLSDRLDVATGDVDLISKDSSSM